MSLLDIKEEQFRTGRDIQYKLSYHGKVVKRNKIRNLRVCDLYNMTPLVHCPLSFVVHTYRFAVIRNV